MHNLDVSLLDAVTGGVARPPTTDGGPQPNPLPKPWDPVSHPNPSPLPSPGPGPGPDPLRWRSSPGFDPK